MIFEDIFLIEPNWKSKVSLRRKWKTEIQTSLVGGEKRSSLFTWPRKNLRFTADALNAAENAYIKRKLYESLDKVMAIPFWMDRTTLSAQANSGQAILNVGSTDYRNFEASGPVIIFGTNTSYETGTILSFTSTQITLDSNLTSTWALGTRVYPLLQAQMSSAQKIKMYTAGMGGIPIIAQEVFDENVTKNYQGDVSAYASYDGYPVFGNRPNWKKRIDVDVNTHFTVLEFLGKRHVDSLWYESFIGHKANFNFHTREELYNFTQFFDYMMGRQGVFYAPSWIADFVVTAAVGAADDTLTVEDIDYASYWASNWGTGTYGDNVVLVYPDKTQVCRQILSAPSSTSIQLNSAVGKDCPADELLSLLVCFLPASRFDVDEIEIEYHSEDVTGADIKFRSVPLEFSSSCSSSSSRSSSSSSLSYSSSSRSSSFSSSSSSSWSSSSSSSSSLSFSCSLSVSSSSSKSSISFSISSSSSSSSSSSISSSSSSRSSSSSSRSSNSISSSSSSRSSSSSSSSSNSSYSLSSSSSSSLSSSSSSSSMSLSSSSSSRSSSSASFSSSSSSCDGTILMTNFNETALGLQPSDWTERWNAGDATAITVAEAGLQGGRVLRIDHSIDNNYAISWDDIGEVADVEVLVKMRWKQPKASVLRIYLRGSGTAGDETGYFVSVQGNTKKLVLYKHVDGVSTQIGTLLVKAVSEDLWYWLRFRAIGSALKYKIWVRGTSEPVGWDKEETDSSISVGWVGLGSYTGEQSDCDYFSAVMCGGTASFSSMSSSSSSQSSSSSSRSSSSLSSSSSSSSSSSLSSSSSSSSSTGA